MRHLVRGLALLLTVTLVAACGRDPVGSAEYRILEDELKTQTAALESITAERDAALDRLERMSASAEGMPPVVLAFKEAYESGDVDRIRAIYTDDAIFTTTDNVIDLYYGNEWHLGRWDMEGSEFLRTATLHSGEMTIIDTVSVGENAVAFGWAWEDFASGTATLHVRDGLIAVAVLTVTQVELPLYGSEPEPREVVESYFEAWNTRDIDRIMSHVAEPASLEIDPAGVIWTDRDEMRSAFEEMFARSEWTIEVSGFETDGNAVTYGFAIFGPDGTLLDSGRSRAVIEDGLIVEEAQIG